MSVLLGILLAVVVWGQEAAKREIYPQWSKMTAVEQNKIYLERYPGTIYFVVSPVEVYDYCRDKLEWDVGASEILSYNDKRVIWTLNDLTPFSKEQLDMLGKQKETELIKLDAVSAWKEKNGIRQ